MSSSSDEDDIEAIQNVIQSTASVSEESKSSSEESDDESRQQTTTCVDCGDKFAPKLPYLNVCEKCKDKADDNLCPPLMSNQITSIGEQADDRIETEANVNATPMQPDVQGDDAIEDANTAPQKGTIEEYIKGIRVVEPAILFEKNHPHYKNQEFKSSKDVQNYLLQPGQKTIYFNNHDNPMIIEAEVKEDHRKRNFNFICCPEKHGEYEGRPYYSYVNLAGHISTGKGLGFLSPSVIVEEGAGGALFDTGFRMIRMWKTRCISAEVWALIFNCKQENFFIVKHLLQFMENRFTAIHLPYEYTERIKDKLEDYLVCQRLLYTPQRKGVPIECMTPQLSDEVIRKTHIAAGNSTTSSENRASGRKSKRSEEKNSPVAPKKIRHEKSANKKDKCAKKKIRDKGEERARNESRSPSPEPRPAVAIDTVDLVQEKSRVLRSGKSVGFLTPENVPNESSVISSDASSKLPDHPQISSANVMPVPKSSYQEDFSKLKSDLISAIREAVVGLVKEKTVGAQTSQEPPQSVELIEDTLKHIEDLNPTIKYSLPLDSDYWVEAVWRAERLEAERRAERIENERRAEKLEAERRAMVDRVDAERRADKVDADRRAERMEEERRAERLAAERREERERERMSFIIRRMSRKNGRDGY